MVRTSCFSAQSGQMTSLVLINSSNARRLTSFLLPTKSTKGQFGCFDKASILLTPMLLYSAASLMVSVIFRWMGTVSFTLAAFPENGSLLCRHFLGYGLEGGQLARSGVRRTAVIHAAEQMEPHQVKGIQQHPAGWVGGVVTVCEFAVIDHHTSGGVGRDIVLVRHNLDVNGKNTREPKRDAFGS